MGTAAATLQGAPRLGPREEDPVTWPTAPDEVFFSLQNPEHRFWPLATSLRVGPPVMDAVVTGHSQDHMQDAYVKVAKQLGIEAVVVRCHMENGVKYEGAILELMSSARAISTTVLDDGVRQNVPEFLLRAAAIQALVECKTSSRSPALISKEDAWAVIQKSSDFDPAMRRVTLRKPTFDETSKKKAAATGELSLVENAIFVEGVLRVIKGEITAKQFMVWLPPRGNRTGERCSLPSWEGSRRGHGPAIIAHVALVLLKQGRETVIEAHHEEGVFKGQRHAPHVLIVLDEVPHRFLRVAIAHGKRWIFDFSRSGPTFMPGT